MTPRPVSYREQALSGTSQAIAAQSPTRGAAVRWQSVNVRRTHRGRTEQILPLTIVTGEQLDGPRLSDLDPVPSQLLGSIEGPVGRFDEALE